MIPLKPKFSQENFEKLFNDFSKLHDFLLKYYKLSWWKRLLFGRVIMKKYLGACGLLKRQ